MSIVDRSPASNTGLTTIIENHGAWLRKEGGRRADLYRAEMPGSALNGVNLTYASLLYANLTEANLSGAVLCCADLQSANLTRAKLQGADLRYADLRGADLRYADLSEANLVDALLTDALLDAATLDDARLPDFQLPPEEGEFVGYKKVRSGHVLTLLIPADASRTSSLVGRKCRASKVKVLTAHTMEGEPCAEMVFHSTYRRDFEYRVGEVAETFYYDSDIRVECTHGVHFFMTKKEAREY